MKWTEDLATGVTQIDDQHKELIERVNQLLAACSAGRGREEVGRTLNFLGDYVVFHFGTEERYMTQYDYPGSKSHEAQHAGFIKEFTDLKGKFETEGPTLEVITKTNRWLVQWLINHIKEVDRELGAFLKAKL